MAIDRIYELIKLEKQDSNDPFPVYALALEYVKTNRTKAESYFNKLLLSFPDYLPTYYLAAEFFIEEEKPELAEDIFKKGITVAKAQNNQKTLAELQNAYQNFLYENE